MGNAIVFSALEAQFDGNAKPFIQASRRVTNESRNVKHVFTSLAADSRRVFGKVSKAVEGTFRRMGNVARRAIRSITIAVAGLTAGMYALSKQAAAAIDTANKFKVVFKGVAKQANKYVDEMSRKFKLPGLEIKKWMASLQDTLFPILKVRGEAEKLSEKITQLAMDFSSFYNVTVEDAIASITSALVGNHEAVRKFGIVITENALAQEALDQKIKTSVKDMSVQQKVLLRLGLIMKGSTDAQGDFNRTAAEGSNTFRTLWLNIKDFGRAIGEVALPWVQRFNVVFGGMLYDMTRLMRDGTRSWSEKWGVFKEYAASVLRSIKIKFDLFLMDIGATELWNNALRQWDIYRTAAVNTWNDIKRIAGNVWGYLQDTWGNLWENLGLGEQFAKIKKFWVDAWESPTGIFGAIKQALEDLIGYIKRKLGIAKINPMTRPPAGTTMPEFQKEIAAAKPSAMSIVSQWRQHPQTAPSPSSVIVNITSHRQGMPDEINNRALAEAIILELKRQGFFVEFENATVALPPMQRRFSGLAAGAVDLYEMSGGY